MTYGLNVIQCINTNWHILAYTNRQNRQTYTFYAFTYTNNVELNLELNAPLVRMERNQDTLFNSIDIFHTQLIPFKIISSKCLRYIIIFDVAVFIILDFDLKYFISLL